jgi:hypothetical protein
MPTTADDHHVIEGRRLRTTPCAAAMIGGELSIKQQTPHSYYTSPMGFGVQLTAQCAFPNSNE